MTRCISFETYERLARRPEGLDAGLTPSLSTHKANAVKMAMKIPIPGNDNQRDFV